MLITDCDHDDVEVEREVLGAAGLELRLTQCRTAAEVVAEGGDAEALIVQYAPIDADVLAALPAVRVVARYGVGVDTIDVEAATAAGVWVANVPDYGTEDVADHALALIYAMLRAVPRLDRAVRAGEWDVTAVRPLRRVSTLTLGIIGAGRIGRALAAKAAGAGLHVVIADPDAPAVDGHERVEIDELLTRSDIVSVHAPLTPATRHLIGAAALARMRPGSYLVNTARGGLVDPDAVLEALESGHLAGAALDVLEQEPPAPGLPLTTHPRALVTPHAAWYSEESYRTLKEEAAREVVRVLEGGTPRSPVNQLPEEGR